MLSSEVASEGLDFQFCDLLINYDLPWNPMRIEQRIGRIDRYGQQSESVAIVNLITPGTVDFDIYERCLSRIGVFRNAIGGSEEILGEITQEIQSIADNFTLTTEQRRARLQQLADNKIRELQAEGELEDKQGELFGLTVPNQSWREEIEDAESFWLSAEALQRCVSAYLSDVAGTSSGYLLGSKPLKTLRLGQSVRATLLEDYRSLGTSKDAVARDAVARRWERWLKGGEPHLPVTFDQETAAFDPTLTYLNVLHPLVRQAAHHLRRIQVVQVRLSASSDAVPPGEYTFALYQWHKVGVRPDDTLVAVTSDPSLDAAIMSLLETATDESDGGPPDDWTIALLDERHHAEWSQAREIHMADNEKLVEHRKHSLSVSHQKRHRVLEDRIATATDDKIRRMRESELARADNDHEQRLAELERQASSADIHTTQIMRGKIHIERA